MRFRTYSYRFAEQVLNSKLELKKEIEEIIGSIKVKPKGFSRPELNKILEAGSRGDKELHIEEFYDARKFIANFMEKTYHLPDVNYEALFEAFKKKYGEPTI